MLTILKKHYNVCVLTSVNVNQSAFFQTYYIFVKINCTTQTLTRVKIDREECQTVKTKPS